MSNEIEHAKNFRDNHLNKVSPTFCSAKQRQSTFHLQNGHVHGCHHPATHKVPVEELKSNPSALHNSEYKKSQRKMMFEGERMSECHYCWAIEDLKEDFLSDRTMKSVDETWAGLDDLQELANMKYDDNVNPTYVEISFSNVCNFSCSYCSPVHSSQWMHEIQTHGPYDTHHKFNNLDWIKQEGKLPIHHREHNPYVEAFWKWWPEMSSTLKVFRITGGEPLLEKNTYKVMEEVAADENIVLNEFSVNSNLCIPDTKLNRFIEKMKPVESLDRVKITRVYTSVDGYGKQAEYGRHGLDYQKWLESADKVLTELPNTKITIMCTANIFSATNFKQMLQDVHSLKLKHYNENRKVPITIDVSMLRWPQHQNIALLGSKYSGHLKECLQYMKDNQEGTNGNEFYKGFFDFEIEKLARLIEYMENGPVEIDHVSTIMRDFYIFVNEHDKRRGTNFLETFPELEEFYNECKKEDELRIL